VEKEDGTSEEGMAKCRKGSAGIAAEKCSVHKYIRLRPV
jgi:hypothetical protein